MRPESEIRLSPGARVFFLTKDPALIRRQLAGELDLCMAELTLDDLLDDINTDTMTPAWACFDHEPEKLAENAYAGLIVKGERLVPEGALRRGNFEVVVSGHKKGVGSSRETAVQAEKFSGIRIAIAASFAPIHARNNINLGVLMAGHEVLLRLQAGEAVPLDAFMQGYDPVTRAIVGHGGLFPFAKALAAGEVSVPLPDTPERPMTIAERIIARHLVRPAADDTPRCVAPGDAVLVKVDGGYSHEFTTAQVHYFLQAEYGADYPVKHPEKLAVFEDHLIYADEVLKYRPFIDKIETLRRLQREFQAHTGVLNYGATDRKSPGICHQVARETFIRPGEIIQATDSHTCMGGASGAFAYGVGATEYANLVQAGFNFVKVPETIRFELTGALRPGAMAKDLMLHILLHYAKPGATLDRVIEFGGPGLGTLSIDERATLANMATECAAKAGICEADEALLKWIAERQGVPIDHLRAGVAMPDAGAEYAEFHTIELDTIEPMVAHPGDPDRGIPSDPTNGALVRELGDVPIDIAYGGSCTAGKDADIDAYHRVLKEGLAAGRAIGPGVRFFLQFGSATVKRHAEATGALAIFERAGVTLIDPGCGACIGCGPGMSDSPEQVTVSAINRNYRGRSGPGRLYLASPATVAASALCGKITAYTPGMFNGGS